VFASQSFVSFDASASHLQPGARVLPIMARFKLIKLLRVVKCKNNAHLDLPLIFVDQPIVTVPREVTIVSTANSQVPLLCFD
jgi:hypothetical protein